MTLEQLGIVGLAVAVTADAWGSMMPNMAEVYRCDADAEYARGVRLTMATAGGVGLAVGAVVSAVVRSPHGLLLSALVSGLFVAAFEYALRHEGTEG
jgi:hypothetical protein